MKYKQRNEPTGRQTNRQSADVDGGEESAAAQVSQGDLDVVLDHKLFFKAIPNTKPFFQ